MKKMLLAALGATMMCGSAQAVDFTFSFTGSSQFPGTVTGTIFGLAETGTSSASRISAQSGAATTVFANGVANVISNSFTISGGQITAFSFRAVRDDFLILNGSRTDLTSDLSLNYLGTTAFRSSDSAGVTSPINVTAATPLSVSFTRVGGTAVLPEPATWAMMIVGFGAIGATMRRRRIAASFA